MRLAFLSALLLLAGCERSGSDDGGGEASFPVPWVEDDVTGGGRPDAGTPDGGGDAGTPDGGSHPVRVPATGQ
jgi:hypothetical protein